MANTTNFGWETPDDTDLVKDGAAAMRTLGNSIDASFVDLKGGTTGQVLSKASNTDLDFTWVTDATGIPATIFDAKGDIIAATAADTASRLAVGANNTVLTADSTEATGLKWASVAANKTFSLLNAGGTNLSTGTTTISGISAQDQLLILVKGGSAGASVQFRLRINTDTGTNYDVYGPMWTNGATYSTSNMDSWGNDSLGYYPIATMSTNTNGTINCAINIFGANSTGPKIINSFGGTIRGSGTDNIHMVSGGVYRGTSTVSSISINCETGSFDAGSVWVYGAA